MLVRTTIFFFLLPFSVFSCICVDPPPINKTTTDLYDVIFCGKVDSVSPCNTNGFATAFFTISELYKGAVSQQVKVEYECQSSCLMTFIKKEEWLIYGKYQRFDLLKASFCDHNRKRISEAAQDVAFMRTQKTFDDEKKILFDILGIKAFTEKNELNEQQADLKHSNQKPSPINKLWLLITSLVVMLIIFYFTRRKKK